MTIIDSPSQVAPAEWFTGALTVWHVTSEQSGGAFALGEMWVRPGTEPPLHIHARERLKLQIGQWPATPQALGLAQRPCGRIRVAGLDRSPSVLDELLEVPEVELAGRDAQEIARCSGDHHGAVAAERPAQPRDIDLQRMARRRRRVIGPQFLD